MSNTPRSHMPEALAEIHGLEAALKREDTLVAWLVRFLDIAEPAESMAHLNETESLDLLTEEITQALEPYRARAEKKL